MDDSPDPRPRTMHIHVRMHPRETARSPPILHDSCVAQSAKVLRSIRDPQPHPSHFGDCIIVVCYGQKGIKGSSHPPGSMLATPLCMELHNLVTSAIASAYGEHGRRQRAWGTLLTEVTHGGASCSQSGALCAELPICALWGISLTETLHCRMLCEMLKYMQMYCAHMILMHVLVGRVCVYGWMDGWLD